MNEVSALLALTHPYIIALKESFVDRNTLCIVMEFADGGDLESAVSGRRRQGMDYWPEEEVLDMFTQLALALKHVHDKKIIHRDLKSENVFLSGDGSIRLGDFGLTGMMTAQVASMDLACGTPFYMAPEVFTSTYNSKADVWSLGCILYEMCALERPFAEDDSDYDSDEDDSEYDSDGNAHPVVEEIDFGAVGGPGFRSVVKRVLFGELPNLPEDEYSPQLQDLFGSILQRDPDLRPDVYQVLEHPLIKPRIKKLLTRKQYLDEFARNRSRRKNRESWLQISDYDESVPMIPIPIPALPAESILTIPGSKGSSTSDSVVASPREEHPYADIITEDWLQNSPRGENGGEKAGPSSSSSSSSVAARRKGVPQLSVQVPALGIQQEGVLFKYNGVVWRSFLFVLDAAEAKLFWYKSEERKAKGPSCAFGSLVLATSTSVYRLSPDDIPPSAATGVRNSSDKDFAAIGMNNAFEVHTKTPSSTSSVLLSALSEGDADTWVDAITNFRSACVAAVARSVATPTAAASSSSGGGGCGVGNGLGGNPTTPSPILRERAFDVLTEEYVRKARSASETAASLAASLGPLRDGSPRGQPSTPDQLPPVVVRRMRTASYQKLFTSLNDG